MATIDISNTLLCVNMVQFINARTHTSFCFSNLESLDSPLMNLYVRVGKCVIKPSYETASKLPIKELVATWRRMLIAIAAVIHLQLINLSDKDVDAQTQLIMGAQRKILRKLKGLSKMESLPILLEMINDLLFTSTRQNKVGFPLALFRKEFSIPIFRSVTDTITYLLTLSVYGQEVFVTSILGLKDE